MNYYKILKRMIPYANEVYKDKNRFNRVVQQSIEKTDKIELFKKISRELKLMFGLLTDYMRGNYRDVKKADIIMIIAGLLYLLNPADIIPDYILFFGFIDDLSVLKFIVKKLDKQLGKYDEWRRNAEKWFF